MPIHLSTEHKTFEIQVPHKEYEHQGSLQYKIQVKNNCPSTYSYEKDEFKGLSDMSDLEFDNRREEDKERTITFSFGDYDITLFGIEKCDCLNDKNISFGQPQRCILDNARVFGYFKEKSSEEIVFIPFVADTKIQILSPDKKFKLSFEVEQIKEAIKNDRYINVNTEYVVTAIITSPKRKVHPYALNIAKWINMVKDPLKTIYDAQKEEWEYE